MYQRPSYKSQTINESSTMGSHDVFSDHDLFEADNRHNRLTFSPKLAPRHLSGENSSNHSQSTSTQRYTMSSSINTGHSAKTATRMPTEFSNYSTRMRNPSSVIHGYHDPDLSWSSPIHNVPISSSNRPRKTTNSPSTGSSAHMFPSPLSAAANDERDQFSIFGSFNRTRSERRDRSDRYETQRPLERSRTPGSDLDSLKRSIRVDRSGTLGSDLDSLNRSIPVERSGTLNSDFDSQKRSIPVERSRTPGSDFDSQKRSIRVERSGTVGSDLDSMKRSIPVETAWQNSQPSPGLTSSGYFSPMKSSQSGPRTLLDLISRDETDEPRLNVSADLERPRIEEREIPVMSSQSEQQSPDSQVGSAETTNVSELRRLARTVDKLNAKLRSSQTANEELQTHLKNLLGERRALLRHIETVEVEEVIEEEEVQRAPQRPARDSTSQPGLGRDVPVERSNVSIGDLPVRVVNAYRTEIIDHERAKMEIEKRTLMETLKIQHQHQLQAMSDQLQSQKSSIEAYSARRAGNPRFHQTGIEVNLSKPQGSTLTAVTNVGPEQVSRASQSELSPTRSLAKDTSNALRSRISRSRVKTTRWQDSVLERLLAALDYGDSEALSAVLEEALLKRETESRPQMTSRQTQIEQSEEPHVTLVREATSSFKHHIRQTQITTTKAQESVLNRLVNALQTNNTSEFWSVINSSLFKSMRTVAVDCTPVTYNKNTQTKQPTFHDKASHVDISKDKPSLDKTSKSVLAKPSVLHKGCQPEELYCFETGTLTDHIFYRSQGVNTLGDHGTSFQSPFPDADAFVSLKSNRSETIRQVKSQFSDIHSTPSRTEIHTEKTESKQNSSQMTSGLESKLNNFSELLEKTLRVKDEIDSTEDHNTMKTNQSKSTNKIIPIPIEVKSVYSPPKKERDDESDQSDKKDEDRNKRAPEENEELSDSSRIHREKIEMRHTSLFQTGDLETNLKQLPDNNVEAPIEVELTHSHPPEESDVVSNSASEELDKVEKQNDIPTEKPKEPSNNFKIPSELSLKQLPEEWERILKAKNAQESNKRQVKDSTDNHQIHFERKEVKESHNVSEKKSVTVTKTTEQSSIMNIREFNQNLEKLNQDIMKTDFTRDSKKDLEIQPETIEVGHVSYLQSTMPGKELTDLPEDWEDVLSSDDEKNVKINDERVMRVECQPSNTEIPIEKDQAPTSQTKSQDLPKREKVNEVPISIDSDHRKDSSNTDNSKVEREFFQNISENERESTMRPKQTFETWHQTTAESVQVLTTNVGSGRQSKEPVPTTVECWETISKIKDGELIENRECYRDKYVSSNPEEILKHIESHQHDHFHTDHDGHDSFFDSAGVLEKFNIYLDNEDQKRSTEHTSKTLQTTVKEIPINTKTLEPSKSVQSPISIPINSIVMESSRTVSSATSSPIMGANLKSFETISNINSVPINSKLSETGRTVSNTTDESIYSKTNVSSKTVSSKTNVPIGSSVTETSKTVSYTTNMPFSPGIPESSTTLLSTTNVPINSGITEPSRTLSSTTNESTNSRIMSSSKTVSSKTNVPIGSSVTETSKTVSYTTNMPFSPGIPESSTTLSPTNVPINSGITESSRTLSSTTNESTNSRIMSSSKTISSKTNVPIGSSVTETSKTVSYTTNMPFSPGIPESSTTLSPTNVPINSGITESSRTLSSTTKESTNSRIMSSSKTVSSKTNVPIDSSVTESPKPGSSTTNVPNTSEITESYKTVSSTTDIPITYDIAESSRTLPVATNESINSRIISSSNTVSKKTSVPISSETMESSETVSSSTNLPFSSGMTESTKKISATSSGTFNSKIVSTSKTVSNKTSITGSSKTVSSTSVPIVSRIVESSQTLSNTPMLTESVKTEVGTTGGSNHSRTTVSSKTASSSSSAHISSGMTTESSKTASKTTTTPNNPMTTESTQLNTTIVPVSLKTTESSKTVYNTTGPSTGSGTLESSKIISKTTTVPISSKITESSKTISSTTRESIHSRKLESSRTSSGSTNIPLSSKISESSKTVPGSPNMSMSSRMSESSKTSSGSTNIPISSKISESSKTIPGSPNMSMSSRMSESSMTSSGSTNVPISSRTSTSSKTFPGSPNMSMSSRMSESSKIVTGSPNMSIRSRMSESSKTVSGSTSIPVNSRISESSRTVQNTSSTIPVMKYSDENDSLRNRNAPKLPPKMEKADSNRPEGVTISERIVSSSISKTSSQSNSVNVIRSPVSIVPQDAIEKETVISVESVPNHGDTHSLSSEKPKIFPKPIKNPASEPFRLTPEIETWRSNSTAASSSSVGSEKSAFYSLSDSSKLFQSLDNEHFEVLLPEDIFQYSSQVLLWLNGNKQNESINIEHFPEDLVQISSILIDWWVDTVIKLSVSQLMGTIKYITSTFSKSLLKFLMTNRDRQGNTCLHYVIGQQFWQSFSALHSTGLVDPNLYNSQGYTVMMVASIIEVSPETLNIFIKMLALGVNLNLQSKQQGQTALFLAALNGNDNTILLLSSLGADINLADNEGNTPLIIAVMNNKIQSVHAILKSPTVLTDRRNKEGNTALSIAESNNFADIVELLKGPRRQQHSERSSFSSMTHNRTFISSPSVIRKFN